MFEYAFMRKAFIAGFFISLIIPLIGTVVINRRTSTIGDAISHTTLGGILLGLIIGLNPLLGGLVFAILATFSIEFFRLKFPKNGDMATAIITSLGIGLTSIFSDFVPGAQNLESFLFGSVISISNQDIIAIIITSLIVLVLYYYLYYGLLYISLDSTGARLAGVKTKVTDFIFTLMLAVTIAISSRMVGVLIISSLMILPVATAILLGKNFKNTVILSIIFGMIYFFTGLILAYYCQLKPGGSIIVVSVLGLLISIFIKKLLKK